ncbi:MAG: replication initiator protein A, partial [Candidatus Omnitrophica bacterium]|nr:replication initiator protein A [Candidatus Omnitrophota bacterium]
IMTRNIKGEKHEVEFVDYDKVNKEKRVIRFLLSGSLGLPTSFDMDVFNALMKIYYKKNYMTNEFKLRTSIFEIVETLSYAHSGQTYKNIHKSLEKLGMVKGYINYVNKNITRTINIFDMVKFSDKEGVRKKGTTDIAYLEFTENFIKSLEGDYGFLIDFDLYKQLTPGLTRRLYEYLQKKNNRVKYSIGLDKLTKRLGIIRDSKKHVRQMLKKVCSELEQKSVIKNMQIDDNDVLHFYFWKGTKYIAQSNEETKEQGKHNEIASAFYKKMGYENPTQELISGGVKTLKSLEAQGFNRDDITYAIEWVFATLKDKVNHINILPNVINQALKKREEDSQKQSLLIEEEKKRDDEFERARTERLERDRLDEVFLSLSQDEQEHILHAAEAKVRQIAGDDSFVMAGAVTAERNRILQEKSQSQEIEV